MKTQLSHSSGCTVVISFPLFSFRAFPRDLRRLLRIASFLNPPEPSGSLFNLAGDERKMRPVAARGAVEREPAATQTRTTALVEEASTAVSRQTTAQSLAVFVLLMLSLDTSLESIQPR